MSKGQSVVLFNGQGGEFQGELVNLTKNQAAVSVLQSKTEDRESPLKVHLVIGISRGERMDWVIQKATELGVTEITPVFTERTEVKLSGPRLEKKQRHWQQIAISACEQSHRNVVPIVHGCSALSSWIELNLEGLKIILHHRTDQKLCAMDKPNQGVILLVGPEGGLSDHEINLAENQGYNPLMLGPRVLRTETAPLAAISIMQSLWGDMG
jgi:16S rRNA (uracil1498-N3)-methyltransferase